VKKVHFAPSERLGTIRSGRQRQSIRPNPPFQEWGAGDVGQTTSYGEDSQDEVIVLRPSHISIPTYRLDHRPPYDEGGVGYRTLDQSIPDHVGDRIDGIQPGLISAISRTDLIGWKQLDVRATTREPRLTIKQVHLHLETLWLSNVIGIHASQQHTPGLGTCLN